ncbi:D-amino-acid transaminase [Orenia metallireducens]|uniref:D-alanine aminotransferase n=1 Tax=Orenia metallireducens TaxID=1413210 RepID=A0A1C0A5T3_9FIRM|nr:D-amino-acid transaminase [Orenia metallireducens]OCL25495.1 D-amino-acid transaminase [Orenia metallireducens]
MNNVAYISGQFVEQSNAKVSIEDRGFQFGDGIYEVIKLYNGKLFKADEHFKRLLSSADLIRLKVKHTLEELKEIALEVIDKNTDNQSGSLYIQVTRGVSPRNHSFNLDLDPTIIMYLLPPQPFPEELWQSGVNAVTLLDTRWSYCNIKTTNLLPNILANQEAKDQGAFEGFFVSPDNVVIEGTSSNVFIIKDGVVMTHPITNKLLSGITREVVLELAKEDFEAKEITFTVEELYDADEVFLTSTTKEVLGVIEVDGRKIHDGKIGPITRKLHSSYRNYIEDINNF